MGKRQKQRKIQSDEAIETHALVPKHSAAIVEQGEKAIEVQQTKELTIQTEKALSLQGEKSLVSCVAAHQDATTHQSTFSHANTDTPKHNERCEERKAGEQNAGSNRQNACDAGGTRSKETTFLGHCIAIVCTFFYLIRGFIYALFPSFVEIFSPKVFSNLCRLVRISHTVFALPFAYVGLILAYGGMPPFYPLLLLTIAMFGARSFAMTMNRIIDLRYDALNPRTQQRELVTGVVTLGQAYAFAVFSAMIFLLASSLLSVQLLYLTPVPLVVSVVYSYMKRFSYYCHFLLGMILALAPIAGELAVLHTVTVDVLLLSSGIMFWVAGFDILYACQDVAFDKKHGLYSIPARFGVDTSLFLAQVCHINTFIFFLLFGIMAGLNSIWYCFLVVVLLLLWLEHKLLKPNDLSKMNSAFFTMNACISVLILVGVFFG